MSSDDRSHNDASQADESRVEDLNEKPLDQHEAERVKGGKVVPQDLKIVKRDEKSSTSFTL